MSIWSLKDFYRSCFYIFLVCSENDISDERELLIFSSNSLLIYIKLSLLSYSFRSKKTTITLLLFNLLTFCTENLSTLKLKERATRVVIRYASCTITCLYFYSGLRPLVRGKITPDNGNLRKHC